MQGRIASEPFHPELFEAPGRVLLAMGDQFEAGRYLFVSGIRKPDYQYAIDTFLYRFANTSASQLHASLPSRARVVPVIDLPSAVVQEFEARGLSAKSLQREVEKRRRPEALSRRGQLTAGIIGVTILGVLILGFLHGLSLVIQWLF